MEYVWNTEYDSMVFNDFHDSLVVTNMEHVGSETVSWFLFPLCRNLSRRLKQVRQGLGKMLANGITVHLFHMLCLHILVAHLKK